jgi:hypothetical protein
VASLGSSVLIYQDRKKLRTVTIPNCGYFDG